ncbi:unnamed protein product, partial [Adineta steineri]
FQCLKQKKTSSLTTQNNFFPFLPTTSITNQNKYNNIQSLSNQLQQTNLSMPSSHIQQQQQPPSPSWNNTSIPHGFPATS